ncbi:MAG: hypothetical protein RBR35_08445 [Salinivirgaceae bacterium]|nr:hypothetical protein [Salinivirgaceae bacterium]
MSTSPTNALSVICPMREPTKGRSRIAVNDDGILHGRKVGLIEYYGGQNKEKHPRKTESNIHLKDRPEGVSFTFFQSPDNSPLNQKIISGNDLWSHRFSVPFSPSTIAIISQNQLHRYPLKSRLKGGRVRYYIHTSFRVRQV